MERYADIVLPLFQPLYTFAVPDGAGLGEGDAVAVQFGAKAVYTGIVWRLHDRRPDVKRVKSVGRRLYDRPLLTPLQMRFWEWIADYYMCTLGEVMRMALPAMAKPRGGDEEEFMMAVAEAGGDDYEDAGDEWVVWTNPGDLMAVSKGLEEQGIEVKGSELTMVPTTPTDVTPADAKKVQRLIDRLEDLDDVQDVYHTMNMTDEVVAALEEE